MSFDARPLRSHQFQKLPKASMYEFQVRGKAIADSHISVGTVTSPSPKTTVRVWNRRDQQMEQNKTGSASPMKLMGEATSDEFSMASPKDV